MESVSRRSACSYFHLCLSVFICGSLLFFLVALARLVVQYMILFRPCFSLRARRFICCSYSGLGSLGVLAVQVLPCFSWRFRSSS